MLEPAGTGRVVNVESIPRGSFLTANRSVGSTSLSVDDPYQFGPITGVVRLTRLSTGATEDVVYSAVNYSTGVITLVSGLVNAYEKDDPVLLTSPDVVNKYAWVRTQDATSIGSDQGGTVQALIPLHLYALLPDGTRDEVNNRGEMISLAWDNGLLIVTNVIGAIPDYDAGYIDPDTIPPEFLGDGDVPPDPGAAPIVNRQVGFNIIDMRSYARPTDWASMLVEYAESSTSGVTGFGVWTELQAQGQLTVHGNLDYAKWYKYRFKALDMEGKISGYSPETSPGVKPRKAGEGGIADIAAGTITADLLSAVITLTSLLIAGNPSGARVEIGDAAIPLVIKDSSGNVKARFVVASSTLEIAGTIRNALATSQPRVEMVDEGGNRGLIRGYASTRTLPGTISFGETVGLGNIRLLAPKDVGWSPGFWELTSTATYTHIRQLANEVIHVSDGIQAWAVAGLGIPGAKCTAGEEWDVSFEWMHGTFLENAPSGATVFGGGVATGVSSQIVNLTTNQRGGRLKMTVATTGTAMRVQSLIETTGL